MIGDILDHGRFDADDNTLADLVPELTAVAAMTTRLAAVIPHMMFSS
jgi:hypothetical protein